MQRKVTIPSAQFWKAAAFAAAVVLVFGAAGSSAGAMISYDASGNTLPSNPFRYLDTTHLYGAGDSAGDFQ